MTNPRQDKLIKLVIDKGYYTVEELAEKLDVSTQTIRRDIKKLSEERLVIRHHGGASSPASKTNLDYEVRKVSATEQKHAIGKAIADLIPDGSTVFITIGTTAEVIASHLADKKNLQVITNSLRVANVLHNNKSIDVLIPSGKIKAFNGGIVGTEALDFISHFRFDYLITSAASMDVDGTLLEYDLNETVITQTVMKSARHVIIALDSSKFIPKGSIELGHIKEATYLFTDQPLSANLESVAKQGETEVKVCEPALAH
ncbi:DeoR/GlpR family DNA-binding transcription regulator (plasmid) [Photobacterium sp. DA100]|uniref:DeoR/GlpR family DNA-binding transcription regulator n=1 Tax=Photobacterium sp. DA100 TaxID=3027472 RepID=UPI00247B2BA5|nr:DeoR/GlpR family DNA-binding transcription regulator [Photobacterium sp. DA100]WEM45262.1 DeoR/GlpR family DNA-binding transcription regulator [Photobacterium sp. DA100]